MVFKSQVNFCEGRRVSSNYRLTKGHATRNTQYVTRILQLATCNKRWTTNEWALTIGRGEVMTETKPRILCVDDEPNVLKFLEAVLVPNGYEVTKAEDGEEALEKLKEKRA